MKAGSQSKYTGSMIQTMRSIVKEDGVTGLWRGAGPTVGRATALAAVEMSSYDHIKTFLIKQNIIVPGTASGVFVTAVLRITNLPVRLSSLIVFLLYDQH